MRIDSFTQIQQMYGLNKPQKTQKATTNSFRDNLQISSAGKDMQMAKQAVLNSSDIRTELVTPIKESIAAGTYDVSGESFADKLLAKYQQTI